MVNKYNSPTKDSVEIKKVDDGDFLVQIESALSSVAKDYLLVYRFIGAAVMHLGKMNSYFSWFSIDINLLNDDLGRIIVMAVFCFKDREVMRAKLSPYTESAHKISVTWFRYRPKLIFPKFYERYGKRPPSVGFTLDEWCGEDDGFFRVLSLPIQNLNEKEREE